MALRAVAFTGKGLSLDREAFVVIHLHAAGSESLGIITVQGSLSSCFAGELRTSVRQALRRFNRVVLSLEQATDIDLDCLQFLCLAHRSAAHAHKSLIVAGVRTGGPVRCTSCALGPGQSCRETFCR